MIRESLSERVGNLRKLFRTGSERDEMESRRTFLKKVGAGAAGLSLLTFPAAAGLNMRTDSFNFLGTDSTPELNVTEDGPVKLGEANLSAENQLIKNVDRINGKDPDRIGQGSLKGTNYAPGYYGGSP